MKLQEMIKLFETHCIYEKNLSAKTIKAYNAYNGVFEQCFQKYLNTFSKNKF